MFGFGSVESLFLLFHNYETFPLLKNIRHELPYGHTSQSQWKKIRFSLVFLSFSLLSWYVEVSDPGFIWNFYDKWSKSAWFFTDSFLKWLKLRLRVYKRKKIYIYIYIYNQSIGRTLVQHVFCKEISKKCVRKNHNFLLVKNFYKQNGGQISISFCL